MCGIISRYAVMLIISTHDKFIKEVSQILKLRCIIRVELACHCEWD